EVVDRTRFAHERDPVAVATRAHPRVDVGDVDSERGGVEAGGTGEVQHQAASPSRYRPATSAGTTVAPVAADSIAAKHRASPARLERGWVAGFVPFSMARRSSAIEPMRASGNQLPTVSMWAGSS